MRVSPGGQGSQLIIQRRNAMSGVNSIVTSSDVSALYGKYSAASSKKSKEKEDAKSAAAVSKAEDTGVVYEPSKDASSNKASTVTSMAKSGNTQVIEQMKAALKQQTDNLRSIVEKVISGQGNAFYKAQDDDSMWKFLADGNFTVDAATKAQAQADIAEDGYWGVNQTSDRILDFAKALAGNDPSKANAMLDAFKEGFKQATKSWGKDLPSISQDTYNAVEKKFQDWANSANDVTKA